MHFCNFRHRGSGAKCLGSKCLWGWKIDLRHVSQGSPARTHISVSYKYDDCSTLLYYKALKWLIFLRLIFPSFYEFILQSDIMVYTSHSICKANDVDRFFGPKDTSTLNTSHPSACGQHYNIWATEQHDIHDVWHCHFSRVTRIPNLLQEDSSTVFSCNERKLTLANRD